MKYFILMLTLAVTLFTTQAEARRMGGGFSFGKQSSNVTKRTSVAPQKPIASPGAGAATAPRRPWGSMLGGLAAGLGLAWLANSLGLGGALGQVLMFGLFALGIMMLFGWYKRSRQASRNQNSPYAFSGAPSTYNPEKVGNDASARPWESSRAHFQSQTDAPNSNGSMIGAALLGSQIWGVPAGFDAEGFLRAAKGNFVSLQAAWDRSDIESLRVMMTDEMLEDIKSQLAQREGHAGQYKNITEVVEIEAQLLGIEDLVDMYLASVEFSGVIREDMEAAPNPFREVWNMSKRKDGKGGWLVAGVQAMQ